MKKMRALCFAIFVGLSCGMIGCDWPPPSKPKAENPEGGSINPLAQTSRYQLYPIDAKTGGTTKTLVFRLDSTNGTTWKLDPDFSKWVLIEGGFPQDPLRKFIERRDKVGDGKAGPPTGAKRTPEQQKKIDEAKKELGL